MGHFQMLVGADVFRGKYRNRYEKPEPFIPEEPAEIVFDLRDKSHCFKKGHRMMVQIQSTWFPVIDRNPQTFVNIYEAKPSDFMKATHTVYRSVRMPSHLQVRVLE